MMEQLGEVISQVIGLLVVIFTWQKLKTMNDGKLIHQKHELQMKLVESEDSKFKAQFELLSKRVSEFEKMGEHFVKEIKDAREDISKTNQRWADLQEGLKSFTTKLKAEADLTDSKIRKAEDLAMAADKKADTYRTELIEIVGKHGLMIVRDKKEPNGQG